MAPLIEVIESDDKSTANTKNKPQQQELSHPVKIEVNDSEQIENNEILLYDDDDDNFSITQDAEEEKYPLLEGCTSIVKNEIDIVEHKPFNTIPSQSCITQVQVVDINLADVGTEEIIRKITELYGSKVSDNKPEEEASETNEEMLEEPIDTSDDLPGIDTPDYIFYGKGPRRRQKDFCCFCKTLVQNFARHIKRNHSGEPEVEKILEEVFDSYLRKSLISELRKRGNFIIASKIKKPVRKSPKETAVLPCPSCLGQYSAKHLWRHKNTCIKKPFRITQAEGQNMLVRNLKIDRELFENVFPRMRADEISLTAKKDNLICEFGSRCLKSNREPKFIHVVSRKMRELSRLLMEIKKNDPNLKTLLLVLKPQNYQIILEAVKRVARYDAEKEHFKSATYAVNIGTSIRQCCEVALEKEQTVGVETDLRTLRDLLISHWRLDILGQVQNDISYNKITMIKLAVDIKQLQDYLIQEGDKAVKDLTNKLDLKTYKLLLENLFCRLVLLNRRTPLELQRILLRTYESSSTSLENADYEEFSKTVTPTEKILLKKFKRIVTLEGKRGNSVPVLFSTDIQEHLKILIQYRVFVFETNNVYLFGNPNTSEPLCDYTVIQRFAKQCGANNLAAGPYSRLHKHFATLSQIFNMSDNDLEQLSAILGIKYCYRLPNDISQRAKISKILMLIESGSLDFRGKSLEEIDVNVEEEIDECNTELGNLEECFVDHHQPQQLEEYYVDHPQQLEEYHVDHPQQPNLTQKKKNVKVRWTKEQKRVVTEFFKNHIKAKKPPKHKECDELLRKYPHVLYNLNWLKIKVFIQNKYCGKYLDDDPQQPNLTQKKKNVKVRWTKEQKRVVTEFFKNHIKAKKPPKQKECDVLLRKYPHVLYNLNWLKIKVFVQNKYCGKYLDDDPQESKLTQKKRNVKVRWTEEQKRVVTEFFENHIKAKKPPKEKECDVLLTKYPHVLFNLNWLKIKVFVQNKYCGKIH